MRRLLLARLAAGAVLAALVTGVHFSGWLEKPEKILLDHQIRSAPARVVSPRLAVVGVTAECREHFEGMPGRGDYARLIERLGADNASAVLLDIFFPLRRDPAGDLSLENAIRQNGRVILPVFSPVAFGSSSLRDGLFHEVESLRGSFPEIEAAAAGIGHINIISDPDQVVRSAPAYIRHREQVYPRLSIEGIRTARESGLPMLAPSLPPLGRSGRLQINYLDPALLGSPAVFRPLNRVLRGEYPENFFSGRLVLVGQTAHGEQHADLVPTPFGYQFGVIVEASILNTLLTGRFLAPWPDAAGTAALVLFCFLVVFILFHDRRQAGFYTALALFLLVLLAGRHLYSRGTIPESMPFFLALTLGYAGSLAHSAHNAATQKKQAFELIHQEEREIGSLITPSWGPDAPDLHDQATFLAGTEKAPATAMRILADATGGEAAYLYQVRIPSGSFSMTAAHGPKPRREGPLGTMVREAAARKSPVFRARPRDNAGFVPADLKVRNFMLLPVISGGSTLAVVAIVNKRPTPYSPGRGFTSSDAQLATIMSFQAVLGVQNANLNLALKNTQLDTIMRLSRAVESRDRETGEHISRITDYATVIACGLDMPDHEIQLLRYAVPMHDIGKISIPDSILLKPGPLTPEERRLIETHCETGAHILAESNSVILRTAEMIALTHHERFDGKGYPRRLEGESIPLYGRITALADVFDAVCSRRCYKNAMPVEEAIELVRRESGHAFDPRLVDVFLANIWQGY